MSEFGLFDTRSGNAVVVALDHGISKGAVEGFRDPAETLVEVAAGDPDGVIVRPPFAQRYQEELAEHNLDVVLTGDVLSFSTTPAGDGADDIWSGAFSPEFLCELSPAGVKIVLIFGRDDEEAYRRNVEHIVALYERLRGEDIPLVVEPVMWGPRIPDELATDQSYVDHASRIGWELGADVLKVPYTGNSSTFRDLVDRTPVPVVILGGPANSSELDTLRDVEDAVEANARGVMIGRSIWQRPNPEGMVRAMRAVVHEGESADTAVNYLDS